MVNKKLSNLNDFELVIVLEKTMQLQIKFVIVRNLNLLIQTQMKSEDLEEEHEENVINKTFTKVVFITDKKPSYSGLFHFKGRQTIFV